jgi:hypothetical protein
VGGEMCPVLAAAETVKRIHSYNIPKDKVRDTQINYIKVNGSGYLIPSSHAKLGFHPDEVGTHSNRLGGAMGMFLAGTPVYTIMLMGQWSFDAFMRYIRKEVLSLSHGITSKMLTFEHFYTVPDFVHNSADGDMRSWSQSNLATTQNFNGSHANMRTGIHPAFHLSH